MGDLGDLGDMFAQPVPEQAQQNDQFNAFVDAPRRETTKIEKVQKQFKEEAKKREQWDDSQ